MSGRFPFATFAAGLPEERRDVFAFFALRSGAEKVLQHIGRQQGREVPAAMPSVRR